MSNSLLQTLASIKHKAGEEPPGDVPCLMDRLEDLGTCLGVGDEPSCSSNEDLVARLQNVAVFSLIHQDL